MARPGSNPRRATSLAEQIGKRQPFSCIQQETFLNLVRTHEKLAGEFARLFKKQGISDSQYNALRILQGEGKPMQVHQIAERMVSPQADISRLIERMVASGLVLRNRCPEDRRVAWVQLTARARSLLRKLANPVKRLHKSQFGSLNQKEIKHLKMKLKKL